MNATVQRRVNLTQDLILLYLAPDAGVPRFIPGQYVALGLPGSAPRPLHFPPESEAVEPGKLIKRAYSIGSSPYQTSYIELYIAIVKEGSLTSRLALIEGGSRDRKSVV